MSDQSLFIYSSLAIVLGIGLYFLPYILGRNKYNSSSIFWLNLLLGWSFIGWVVALIWALSKDQKPVIIQNNVVSVDTDIEKLNNYKKLLDTGVISQEEFDKKKSEILNS